MLITKILIKHAEDILEIYMILSHLFEFKISMWFTVAQVYEMKLHSHAASRVRMLLSCYI